MPSPSDQDLVKCYVNALASWQCEGVIVFKERAQAWANVHLAMFRKRDYRELGRLMYEYVKAGGEIDQQPETRSTDEWKDDAAGWDYFKFHYDLRIPIDDKIVYFETRLICDDPDDPIIHVVNIHGA